MIKTFTKALFFLFLTCVVFGCKLDAPVYPEGTVANPNAEENGGNGGGGGGTVSGRTITYTIDGKTTTLKDNVVFASRSAQELPPDGALQIGGGTDVSNLFSFLAPITGTGTFDISLMAVGTTLVGDGKVTVTQYGITGSAKGSIAGTFTGELADIGGGANKTVTGSFSIKM